MLTLPALLLCALLLTHARPQTASSIDCCACTEASTTDDTKRAGDCLALCGYAVLRQSFDPAVLARYNTRWTAWYLGKDGDAAGAAGAAGAAVDAGAGEAANAPELPRSHYLSYNDDGMLRGSRVHLVPPLHIPVEHLLYSRGFMEVYLAALEVTGLTAAGTTTRAAGTATRAGTREKPMLDYATIMHTSYPSCDQTFHQDAPFPEGMRVQLPLMDVPLDLGPIQIKPEINARTCPIVHAVTKVGDVILYRHSVRHMGAKNRAAKAGKGGKNRTVIDVSYLFPGTIPKDQFVFKSKFPPAAHSATARYRKSVKHHIIVPPFIYPLYTLYIPFIHPHYHMYTYIHSLYMYIHPYIHLTHLQTPSKHPIYASKQPIKQV